MFYETLERLNEACEQDKIYNVNAILSTKSIRTLVNKDGESLLWYANEQTFPYLIEKVDVNIKNKYNELFLTNYSKEMIDHFLNALYEKAFITPLNPNISDEKNERVLTFYDWEKDQILRFLKYSGPNIDRIEPDIKISGGTLIHMFADYDECNEILEELLRYANPLIKNDYGMSALDVAVESNAKKNIDSIKSAIKLYRSRTIHQPVSTTKSWASIVKK